LYKKFQNFPGGMGILTNYYNPLIRAVHREKAFGPKLNKLKTGEC